jgi:hypothetical protein
MLIKLAARLGLQLSIKVACYISARSPPPPHSKPLKFSVVPPKINLAPPTHNTILALYYSGMPSFIP